MKTLSFFPTVFLTLLSIAQTYAALLKPALATPQQGETNVYIAPRLTWRMDPAYFRYQVSKDPQFATVFVDSTVYQVDAGKYPVVGPLQYKTTYYWRVEAVFGTDTSVWSDIWHFTTTAQTAINPPKISLQRLSLKSGDILQFSLPQKSLVKILIYDSKGVVVKTLLDETRGEGSYTIPLPQEFLQGFYLLDFTAGKFHKVMKL